MLKTSHLIGSRNNATQQHSADHTRQLFGFLTAFPSQIFYLQVEIKMKDIRKKQNGAEKREGTGNK